MKTKTFIGFVILLAHLSLYPQLEIPVYKEFKQAVDKGTRTLSGIPGSQYFTNYGDYIISAEFDPETGKISGQENITYHNNSADTLHVIVIRLNFNIYKKGSGRDYMTDARDITDGVSLKSLMVDDSVYTEKDLKYYNTILYVNLKKPVLPHSQAVVSIVWDEQMAMHHAMRNGKYGAHTFFVGYWYPQISVYDDVFGWATKSYTGVQEFYNDHNNYDVRISVPAGNVVWASGRLQNYREIFKLSIARKLEQAYASEKIVNIITKDDLAAGVFKKEGKVTWHFVAKKHPDFAFATSDRYVWDGSMLVQENSQKVFISAAYNPDSKSFSGMALLARRIIDIYSRVFPKLPFPYPSMTIFNGGGAMEYPGMVNEADFEKTCDNIYVTAHEIGHTYFPFYAGTNEIMYAWMDEGLINFFPRYVQTLIDTGCHSMSQMIRHYKQVSGSAYDMPIMTPTDIFSSWKHYRHIAYNKPSFAFYQLVQYLGKEKFAEGLRLFIQNWHYKHPYPYDFFATFNRVARQDLSWFWIPYFFNYGYVDIAIDSAKYANNELVITLLNKGGLPVETPIRVFFEDGSTKTVVKPMSIWKEAGGSVVIHLEVNKPVKAVSVESPFLPDIYPNDNMKEVRH